MSKFAKEKKKKVVSRDRETKIRNCCGTKAERQYQSALSPLLLLQQIHIRILDCNSWGTSHADWSFGLGVRRSVGVPKCRVVTASQVLLVHLLHCGALILWANQVIRLNALFQLLVSGAAAANAHHNGHNNDEQPTTNRAA